MNLVKVMMSLSGFSGYKLSITGDRSIVEIYAYRLILKSFIESETTNPYLLQYLVKTFINLSKDKRFVIVRN